MQPHYLNTEWEYYPADTHDDASKFRSRMEARKKEAEAPKPTTTDDN